MYSKLKDNLINAYKKIEANSLNPRDFYISLKSEDGKYYAIIGNINQTVSYDNILILDEDLQIIDGNKELFSSRFFAHYLLYKSYSFMNCIIHQDSKYVSIWSGFAKALPPATLLHTYNFFGELKCVELIKYDREQDDQYVKIGKAIADTIETQFPIQKSAIYVRSFGAFVWSSNIDEAVNKSIVLEEITERMYDIGRNKMETFSCLPYELLVKNYFSLESAVDLDAKVVRNLIDDKILNNCRGEF